MSEAEADRATPAPPVRLNPSRHRWLKGVISLAALFLLVAIGLWVWWHWEANRRLQAKIEEYRAAGQPVLFHDFARPPVPDDQNAALSLRQAAAAIVEPKDVPLSVKDVLTEPEMLVENAAHVQRLTECNAEALRLVRLARQQPGVDWGVPLTSPLFNLALPDLGAQKKLARLCCVAALHYHQQGDDRRALEMIRSIKHISECSDDAAPMLLVYLVSARVMDMSISALEQTSANLRIGADTDRGDSASGAVSRATVRALIYELLVEEPVRRSWERACYGERLMEYDGAEWFYANARGIWLLLRPAYRVEAVFTFAYSTAAAEAGWAPDWPTGDSILLPFEDLEGVDEILHQGSSILLPSFQRALALHYSGLLRRRLGATALAIRLYELDHGTRPPRLEMLVPDYLPAVPGDAFSGDGQPIAYRPESVPPVLYSVGLNGVDEGGLDARIELPGGHRQPADIVFFLDGDRPRPARRAPTSAEAVGDDIDEPDAERKPAHDPEKADEPGET